jgi:hypothetical protein
VGGGAWSAGELTVARSTVSGNHGMLIGGGLAAGGGATLTDVSVRDNDVAGLGRTGGGGGIDTAGAVRLTRTVISGNKANARWGGGGVGPLPAQLSGGGVRAGSVVAVDSTVAGNVVIGGELQLTAPVPREQQVTGGGIAAATSVDLTNTTVSGNSMSWATSVPDNPSARGAGVSAGSVRLVHATLTGNTLDDATAGVPAAGTLQTATLSAVGSVIVPASGQRACTEPVAAEPSSFSVVGDTTCGLTGPGVRTDASGVALAALADNGGPVPTQLPGPGSTLIDAATVSPLAADARGVPRPQGPASDIGAVEVVAAS